MINETIIFIKAGFHMEMYAIDVLLLAYMFQELEQVVVGHTLMCMYRTLPWSSLIKFLEPIIAEI